MKLAALLAVLVAATPAAAQAKSCEQFIQNLRNSYRALGIAFPDWAQAGRCTAKDPYGRPTVPIPSKRPFPRALHVPLTPAPSTGQHGIPTYGPYQN